MIMPAAIAHYASNLSIRGDAIAYLEISPTGHLRSWGGQLEKYDLNELSLGERASKYLQAIDGFFPLQTTTEVLPYIHLKPNLVVDIHLFVERFLESFSESSPDRVPRTKSTTGKNNSSWILLVDTTAKAYEQQARQQKGNELRLLKHLQSKHPVNNPQRYSQQFQTNSLAASIKARYFFTFANLGYL